jgi:hypothetical protein
VRFIERVIISHIETVKEFTQPTFDLSDTNLGWFQPIAYGFRHPRDCTLWSNCVLWSLFNRHARNAFKTTNEFHPVGYCLTEVFQREQNCAVWRQLVGIKPHCVDQNNCSFRYKRCRRTLSLHPRFVWQRPGVAAATSPFH